MDFPMLIQVSGEHVPLENPSDKPFAVKEIITVLSHFTQASSARGPTVELVIPNTQTYKQQHNWLVVEKPLWKILVSWDYYFQHMEK